jgi:hypothetical protein
MAKRQRNLGGLIDKNLILAEAQSPQREDKFYKDI